jgi:hypothetical protein
MKKQVSRRHIIQHNTTRRQREPYGTSSYDGHEANNNNNNNNNNKEKTCILIDVAIPADRNVMQKGSREETKLQEFICRDTTVKHKMYGYIEHHRTLSSHKPIISSNDPY